MREGVRLPVPGYAQGSEGGAMKEMNNMFFLVTSASLLVTSASLLVTRSY